MLEVFRRMELLLNLVWLLMALPGYWLWRTRVPRGSRGQAFTGVQCLLALGCMLILLFPVISATDDVRAMRCEVEEPGTDKRSVRQAGGDRNSALVNRLQAPPATVTSAVWLVAPEAALHKVSVPCLAPLAAPRICRSSRAPPFAFLG